MALQRPEIGTFFLAGLAVGIGGTFLFWRQTAWKHAWTHWVAGVLRSSRIVSTPRKQKLICDGSCCNLDTSFVDDEGDRLKKKACCVAAEKTCTSVSDSGEHSELALGEDQEKDEDVEEVCLQQQHGGSTFCEEENHLVFGRIRANGDNVQHIDGVFPSETGTNSASLPGNQWIYVKTFGCSHNISDSETMMGLLQEYGYRFTSNLEDASVCVINSCTVKNPSQEALLNIVQRARQLKKPVVVAGCIPQADKKLKGLENVSVIGTTQIARVVEVVEKAIEGYIVRLLEKGALPSLNIPKVRRNALIEIVPISSGCLGACTYCKTKHARGHLGSYEPEAIVDRISVAVQEGVQQIWLASEDVGAYGIDLGTHIGALLKQCLAKLEDIEQSTGKRVMLRIGMTNPPYMAAHIDMIADALNHRNAFKFIHIPVQSGSSKVLQDMVREYSVEDFNHLVATLRERVPNITIATDIICGFPTEKDEDHQETLKLLRRWRFPVVNISQFYPRPGTPAARMKRVPTQIVKKRSGEVTAAFHSYISTEFLLQTYQKVWFSEVQEAHSQTVGHTIHYVKVVVPLDLSLIGTSRWVYVTNVTKWHVEGEIVKGKEEWESCDVVVSGTLLR